MYGNIYIFFYSRTFDARRISPENRQAVEKLIAEKKESFDPKIARKASVAAAPLAAWVVANVKYSYVLEKIRPLEREQSKLHQNLKLAEEQIGQLSMGLTNVDKTVAELKNQLNTYTKEAAELEIHLSKAQETINAAEGLVGKLNDEYERWKSQVCYYLSRFSFYINITLKFVIQKMKNCLSCSLTHCSQ